MLPSDQGVVSSVYNAGEWGTRVSTSRFVREGVKEGTRPLDTSDGGTMVGRLVALEGGHEGVSWRRRCRAAGMCFNGAFQDAGESEGRRQARLMLYCARRF